MSGLRSAIGFLTPLGGASEPSPAAVWWFPEVGAFVGLAVGALWWGTSKLWPPAVAAALAVIADLALTGMLHFDGLCDSADGLLAHMPLQRRLEVMADPHVGAFGMATGGATLLWRWALLMSVRPSPLLLGALWAMSRTVMATALLAVPYARPGGLAKSFVDSEGGRGRLVPVVTAGSALALVLALLWRPVIGPASVAAGLLGGAGVVLFARRRIGGFTGDVLGAAGVMGETVGLLVAAAKW